MTTHTWGAGGNGHRFGTVAGAQFWCPVVLPHGAAVTEFRATLRDTNATVEITCNLDRRRMTSPDIGSTITLATVSSGGAFAGGSTEVTDSTIDNATIDHRNYTYYSACGFSNAIDSSVGFFGTTIEYTVTGAQGAAA